LIANYTNKIILSNYDQAYLDVGSGTRVGTPYGTFESWGTMRKFTPNVTGIRGTIIGGESCLWSEMNNDHT
jgi:hexosaminidase